MALMVFGDLRRRRFRWNDTSTVYWVGSWNGQFLIENRLVYIFCRLLTLSTATLGFLDKSWLGYFLSIIDPILAKLGSMKSPYLEEKLFYDENKTIFIVLWYILKFRNVRHFRKQKNFMRYKNAHNEGPLNRKMGTWP